LFFAFVGVTTNKPVAGAKSKINIPLFVGDNTNKGVRAKEIIQDNFSKRIFIFVYPESNKKYFSLNCI